MKLIFDPRVIGQNLIKVRTAQGLTRPQVAEKANLADRSYYNIERGSVCPSLYTFLNICQALSVTPNDILVDLEDFDTLSDEELIENLKNLSFSDQGTVTYLIKKLVNK